MFALGVSRRCKLELLLICRAIEIQAQPSQPMTEATPAASKSVTTPRPLSDPFSSALPVVARLAIPQQSYGSSCVSDIRTEQLVDIPLNDTRIALSDTSSDCYAPSALSDELTDEMGLFFSIPPKRRDNTDSVADSTRPTSFATESSFVSPFLFNATPGPPARQVLQPNPFRDPSPPPSRGSTITMTETEVTALSAIPTENVSARSASSQSYYTAASTVGTDIGIFAQPAPLFPSPPRHNR